MSEQDKKIVAPEAPNAEVGSAAEVDEIMRKYDRESNTRIWQGVPRILIGCILTAFSLFCIYVTLFGKFLEQERLASFMGLVILMGYLTYPAKKGIQKVNHIPWYDFVLMFIGAGAFLYFTFNAHTLIESGKMQRIITRNPQYWIIGILGIVSLVELCRRSVGIPILCVAGVFVAYCFINGETLQNVIYYLFYSSSGVLTTPINVCSKFIVVFIIFGAFLERTGISDFFISVANSLCGRFAGGPAKVAVISSALCGMVSGSSVGNTVTTGSVTIPMMKKTGYRAEFAGAVEASASTGGQIMPPIMGAAAFLMAEYVGEPYSNIIVRAILPAVLYFLGIFIAVHLEAKKLGLKGIPRELLPRMKELIKDTYLLLPLIILVYLVCSNTKTMQFSAAVAILAAIGVGFINNLMKHLRARKNGDAEEAARNPVAATFGIGGGFGVKNIFEALEAGGRGCISVAVACGIAGIIAGCLTVTGLASKLNTLIVGVAQNNVFFALFLTMLCCIILGMGVPTTANYCIMASTCAPILISMGIPTVAAHFFVFYFGIVADITPPVALAAYAGSAIAKGNPMKTGVTATRLAIAAFIIPYVFAFSPELLFIGDVVWYNVVLITLTATIGMIGVAAGLSGYLLKDMNIIERLLTIAGGLLMIIPGTVTDLAGLALIAVVVLMQVFLHKKAAKAA